MGAKQKQNRKCYAILPVLAMLVTVFDLYPAISSQMSEVVIRTTGSIGFTRVIAASGSAADIQAAVNEIQNPGDGTGTVFIPDGIWIWSGTETVTLSGGVSIRALNGSAGCKGHEDNWDHYTPNVILRSSSRTFATFFNVLGANGKPTRISGIQFEAVVPEGQAPSGRYIELDRAKDYRIDHCTLLNFGIAIFADADYDGSSRTWGVVDHCYADNPYKWSDSALFLWGYGFYSRGDIYNFGQLWRWEPDVAKFAGHYDDMPIGTAVMFVEDCHMRVL